MSLWILSTRYLTMKRIYSLSSPFHFYYTVQFSLPDLKLYCSLFWTTDGHERFFKLCIFHTDLKLPVRLWTSYLLSAQPISQDCDCGKIARGTPIYTNLNSRRWEIHLTKIFYVLYKCYRNIEIFNTYIKRWKQTSLSTSIDVT